MIFCAKSADGNGTKTLRTTSLKHIQTGIAQGLVDTKITTKHGEGKQTFASTYTGVH